MQVGNRKNMALNRLAKCIGKYLAPIGQLTCLHYLLFIKLIHVGCSQDHSSIILSYIHT